MSKTMQAKRKQNGNLEVLKDKSRGWNLSPAEPHDRKKVKN